jgi:hypothetical protein
MKRLILLAVLLVLPMAAVGQNGTGQIIVFRVLAESAGAHHNTFTNIMGMGTLSHIDKTYKFALKCDGKELTEELKPGQYAIVPLPQGQYSCVAQWKGRGKSKPIVVSLSDGETIYLRMYNSNNMHIEQMTEEGGRRGTDTGRIYESAQKSASFALVLPGK